MEEEQKLKQEEGKTIAEIHIVRHSKLLDMLSKPRVLWRSILLLLLILFVFLIGLSLFVLVIKKYYPYNQIETTKYGATIMKSEDKEVIYWLLNTADVWSNSGIEVEAGEELTIRASGLSHAAIHHLVKNARDNHIPKIRWENADGQNRHFENDPLEGKYRLGRYQPEGMLLMHIFSSDDSNDSRDWVNTKRESVLNDEKYTYAIGQERRNFIVPKSGVLHFSINDILLTDKVIHDIYSEYFDYLMKVSNKTVLAASEISERKETVLKYVDSIKSDNDPGLNDRLRKRLCVLNDELFNDSILMDKLLKSMEDEEDESHKKQDTIVWFDPYRMGRDPEMSGYPLVTELLYYKANGFRNAWFVDNIGSMLIVIERRKH